MSNIEAELQLTAGTTLDVNDPRVRAIPVKTTPGSTIAFSNFYGQARDLPPTTWTGTTLTNTNTNIFTYSASMKPYINYNGSQFNVFGAYEYLSSPYYTFGIVSADGITWTSGSNTNLYFGTLGQTYPTQSVTTPIYSSTSGRYYMYTAKFLTSSTVQVIVYYNTSPNSSNWLAAYTSGTGSSSGFSAPTCSIAQGNYILYFASSVYNTGIFGSSDGGSTWTISSTISNATQCDVKYYNGTFYLLTTYNGTTGLGLTHNMYSSTNGTTWTIVSNVYTTTTNITATGFDISSNGVFAASFNDGYIRTSTDGITWTTRTITGVSTGTANSFLLKAICWAGPKYLLAA